MNKMNEMNLEEFEIIKLDENDIELSGKVIEFHGNAKKIRKWIKNIRKDLMDIRKNIFQGNSKNVYDGKYFIYDNIKDGFKIIPNKENRIYLYNLIKFLMFSYGLDIKEFNKIYETI